MANIIDYTHPDLAFAFNPIPVEIFTDEPTDIKLTVDTGHMNEIEIVRNTFAGKDGRNKVTFDLSGIVRSLFDRDEFHKTERADHTLFKSIEVNIYLEKNEVPSLKFDISILWGALQIGEKYSQSKRLTYFRGYPFTVPLFLPHGSHTIMYSNIKDSIIGGKYNLDITNYIPENRNRYRIAVLGEPDENEQASFFDYTFDYTFRKEAVNDIYIDIDVEDCPKDGYYLRWINCHGEWNYYLFHKKNASTQTSDSNIIFDQYFTTIDFVNGYHAGTGKTIGKEVKQSIQLYAALVDSPTFDFLTQMVQSPVVDLFIGYDDKSNENWMSINTQAGTFAKSSAHLQDFECTLQMPEVFTQKL